MSLVGSVPRSSLLMDLATMVKRLEHDLASGPTLDAYLLAAGIAQITDDYLHGPPYTLDAATRYLAGRAGAAGAAVSAMTTAAIAAERALSAWRAERAGVLRWRERLAVLVDALAGSQVREAERGSFDAGLARAGAVLAAEAEGMPVGLRRAVVRLPACFQGFDQRPADVISLAERFLASTRGPGRGRPLLVVGVRTSGSYLAPLLASALSAFGFSSVRTLTVRPGHPLLPGERALVRALAGERGVALVLDDPPVSGASVAATATQLERAGFPSHSIVLMLAVFGAAELPPMLRRYEALLLPSSEWSVTADLTPAAVRGSLSELLGVDAGGLTVERVPLPSPQPARGHVRARYAVRMAGSGESIADVLIEGVGIGYLGAHRLVAGPHVDRFGPISLGLRNGLLYREWLPDTQRIAPLSLGDEDVVARAIAAYAAERRRALPLEEDLGLRMAGRQPAWEIAGAILSRAFGRGWPVAQVLLTARAAKRVLRVPQPSVVDGNTDLAQWFRRNGSPASLVKPDVGEDRFSNLSSQCFDAVFDLAGASARSGSRSLPSELRRAFGGLTGDVIDEERWLLYELAHLWGRERTQPDARAELRRAGARALQRYFADVYLSDVPRENGGPLCALDIDGVLECDQLGFSGLTPASALALRSLLAHGYRPVLASGRSLDDVADRCRIYGLAGGVAEYGAVTFEGGNGRVQTLVTGSGASALGRLRAALASLEEVHLDTAHRFSVRAFQLEHGRRRALSEAISAEALARAGDAAIKTVRGDGQTDFVAPAVDKALGLRALAASLGEAGEPPFALGVGDTAADLTLASVSARACAPGHADPVLAREGFAVMRRQYQAGLAEAVTGLLGHRPGGCPVCRMPPPTRARAIVTTALGVQERGRLGIPMRAVELGWRVR